MLVLTRREGERITINDNIVVTVVQVRGNKVRVGIAAPANVPSVRNELLRNTVDDLLDVG